MDVVLDCISVSTFWTILLIFHSLLAVALLGALTHQAIAVAMPVRQIAGRPGFVTRFRSVYGAAYVSAICVLWVLRPWPAPETLVDRQYLHAAGVR